MAVIPAFTVLLSLVFAIQVFLQYRNRGKSYQLAWSLALLFYAVAALPEFLAGMSTWSELGYRVYYLFGALLLVPWLSLGTAELLMAPGTGRTAYRVFVGVVTVLAVVSVAGATLHAAHLATSQAPSNCTFFCNTEHGYNALNGVGVAMAILGNSIGTVVLAGGAGLSAWRAYRGGLPGHVPAGNVLILVGALVVASASSLTRFGIYELFYVGQALGIAVIFAGFFVINSSVRVARPSPA